MAGRQEKLKHTARRWLWVDVAVEKWGDRRRKGRAGRDNIER